MPVLSSKENDHKLDVHISNHTGLSKTHFCLPGQNHVWNGLALVNSRGNVEDELYIDASFRIIKGVDESGYTKDFAYYGLNKYLFNENAEIPIGEFEISESGLKYNLTGAAVLGASDDFRHIYEVGFAKNRSTGKIMPILVRDNEDGSHLLFFYLEEYGYQCTNLEDTDLAQRMEMITLLDYARSIKIVEGEPVVNVHRWHQS